MKVIKIAAFSMLVTIKAAASFLTSQGRSSLPSLSRKRLIESIRTSGPPFTTTSLRLSSTPSTVNAAVTEEKILENVLYRIRKVNYLPDEVRASSLDFVVDDKVLGIVRPKIANLLCDADPKNPIFCISDQNTLTLTKDAGTSVEDRTFSVNRIMKILAEQGIVTGWRDEDYPVKRSFYEDTMFGVERASASLLGIMEYGVHINGIVTTGEGPKMWMARRAADKSKYPGMLDHVVAGGQPVGLSLLDNVVKECQEEAGIPKDVTLAGLKSSGAISYYTYSQRQDCITRCVLFCYDLHLPPEFKPIPVDGEVEEFFLWNVDQIKASMDPAYHDPIKPNCYPVIIDYLLRNGHFASDTKGYLDVLRELRSGDCY